MKKLLSLFILMFLTLSLLCACELPKGDGGDGDGDLYRVMLSLPAGVTVEGSNPVSVRPGDTVRFKLNFANDTMFAKATHGKYNYATRTLTIDSVESDINATLSVNKYDFDTSVTYNFIMRGTAADDSNLPSGTEVNAGVVASVTAGDEERIFVGWSFGDSSAAGAEIVSTERSYSFVVSSEYADKDGKVTIYANYTDTNVLYYHPNGGQINVYSANYTDKSYYKATLTTLLGDRVMKLKVSDNYLSKVESYSSLYDDGTFYRKGYVLKEYNTKPDGTGEAYSLGSKVYFDPATENPTLYCIWAEETPVDAFTYTNVTIPCPYSKKAQRAPDWKESGVIISSYTGNAETVVIPEKIGDKYVIAIGAGAFKNKDVKTVVFNRFILRVADGAFRECPSLDTLYLNDGIYDIGNGAFDAETYTSFKRLIVNATIAPRFSNNADGSHAIKMSRLLAGKDEKKLIVIGGSSIYQGLGTEYLEALLDGEYRVVNFGTTRTTHGTLYLEAMSYYANEGDIIIYAPENSSYMLGERELYWKTLRDLEGMNNIYRHVDISQYTNVFAAFSDYNRNYRYSRDPQRYEKIADEPLTDKNGDRTQPERAGYVDDERYLDVYFASLNNRIKSRFDENWMDDALGNKEDYNNPNNVTWCSIDDPYYLEPMNRVINAAKSSGAKVYFGYCPCDADSLVEAAKNYAWLRAYDALIADIYDYDGIIGKCEDYIYNHVYFFDCAFHLNDYGRTYRTYQLYLDLCDEMGVEAKYQINSLGTLFDGCKFEPKTTGKPKIPVDYLTEG